MSDHATCPWCGETLTDLWDYSWSSEVVITECGHCLEPIDIVRHITVRYEVRKGQDDDD